MGQSESDVKTKFDWINFSKQKKVSTKPTSSTNWAGQDVMLNGRSNAHRWSIGGGGQQQVQSDARRWASELKCGWPNDSIDVARRGGDPSFQSED